MSNGNRIKSNVFYFLLRISFHGTNCQYVVSSSDKRYSYRSGRRVETETFNENNVANRQNTLLSIVMFDSDMCTLNVIIICQSRHFARNYVDISIRPTYAYQSTGLWFHSIQFCRNYFQFNEIEWIGNCLWERACSILGKKNTHALSPY